MNVPHAKHPRTPHLQWSPGRSPDDETLSDDACFEGSYVVVTEKMDGECTTMYHDGIHARSLESSDHPSRHYVKAMHAGLAEGLKEVRNTAFDGPMYFPMAVCGENMFAKHSIFYPDLRSYFLVHSLWAANQSPPSDYDVCLNWAETVALCKIMFGLQTVPEIWSGIYDRAQIERAYGDYKRSLERESEGYVVRNTCAFKRKDFGTHVAKYVRENHVQTNDDWLREALTQNLLDTKKTAKNSNRRLKR